MLSFLSFVASQCSNWLGFLPHVKENNTASDPSEDQIRAHVTTEIRLKRLHDHKDGRRHWDIEVINNGVTIHDCVSFEDEMKPEEYSDVFDFAATKSLITAEEDRPADYQDQVDAAKAKINRNGLYLVNKAMVDDPKLAEDDVDRIIFIVEEVEKNHDDKESLHNAVWEQLENLAYWKITKPRLVNVTRTLRLSEDSDDGNFSDDDSQKTAINYVARELAPGDPVRILLVTGRHLYHYDESGKLYDEQEVTSYRYDDISPGIIESSIRQVIRHLKEVGFHRKISLDIVRPGTFDTFKSYLEDGGVAYDLIHLDMHAEMRENDFGKKEPHFRFLEVRMGPQAFIAASEVAKTLSRKTNLLVWNACNESSTIGGLGIGMIRPFLNKGIACIAATSYKLLVPTAEIFYPTFYMSFLVKNGFNRAAADGRQALKDRQDRYEEKRDDSYVIWNWSSNIYHQNITSHDPPAVLYWKMVSESGHRLWYWLICLLFRRPHSSKQHQLMFPMHHAYHHFRELKCHVSCSARFDIPKASLHAHEVEYYLSTLPGKDNHNSIYLYPGHEREGNAFEFIEVTMKNMVRTWVDTNFVIEARMVDVEKMIQEAKKPWKKVVRSWKRGYVNLMRRSDWTWSQEEQQVPGQRQPEIKGMLVICGIDCLLPDDRSTEVVLDQIEEIAREMKERHGEFYAITTGKMRPAKWTKLTGKFAQKTLGEKWADPATMLIPDAGGVHLASYDGNMQKDYLECPLVRIP